MAAFVRRVSAAAPRLSRVAPGLSGVAPTGVRTYATTAATAARAAFRNAESFGTPTALKEMIAAKKAAAEALVNTTGSASRHMERAEAESIFKRQGNPGKAVYSAHNAAVENLARTVVEQKTLEEDLIPALERPVRAPSMIPSRARKILSVISELHTFQSIEHLEAAIRIHKQAIEAAIKYAKDNGLPPASFNKVITYAILRSNIADTRGNKGSLQGLIRQWPRTIYDDKIGEYRPARKEDVGQGKGALTADGEHINPVDFRTRAFMECPPPGGRDDTTVTEMLLDAHNNVRTNYDGAMPADVNTKAMNALYNYSTANNVPLRESWENLSTANKELINTYHSNNKLIVDGQPIVGIDRIIYVGLEAREKIRDEQYYQLLLLQAKYPNIDEESLAWGYRNSDAQYDIGEKYYGPSLSRGGALNPVDIKLLDDEFIRLSMLLPDDKTVEITNENEAAEKIINYLQIIEENKKKVHHDVEILSSIDPKILSEIEENAMNDNKSSLYIRAPPVPPTNRAYYEGLIRSKYRDTSHLHLNPSQLPAGSLAQMFVKKLPVSPMFVNKHPPVSPIVTQGLQGGKTRRYRARRQTRRLRKSRGTMKRKQKKTRRQK